MDKPWLNFFVRVAPPCCFDKFKLCKNNQTVWSPDYQLDEKFIKNSLCRINVVYRSFNLICSYGTFCPFPNHFWSPPKRPNTNRVSFIGGIQMNKWWSTGIIVDSHIFCINNKRSPLFIGILCLLAHYVVFLFSPSVFLFPYFIG